MTDILLFCLFILLYLLIVALLIVSIIFIYLTIASGFMRSSPSVPSCGKVKRAMLEDVAAILNKSSQVHTIIDLGSGWGTLLLPLARQFPQHQFVGYEIARLPYFISCLRSHKLKNITFHRMDILKADISKADIIFLFLLPSMMQKLTDKCKKEMKSNSLIYSNRFRLPDVNEHQKISLGSDFESFYIYKM